MKTIIDEALTAALAGGPVDSSAVKSKLQGLGCTDKQIRGARERLGVIVRRVGFGTTSASTWSLPALVPIADAFVPSDSAFVPLSDALVPSLPAFVPAAEVEALRQRLHDQIDRETIGEAHGALAAHQVRKAHAVEVQRLEHLLAGVAVQRITGPLDRVERRLLGALASESGWMTTLDVTVLRIDGLKASSTALKALSGLADRGLAESRPTGKASRHGTPVRAFRISEAGREELVRPFA